MHGGILSPPRMKFFLFAFFAFSRRYYLVDVLVLPLPFFTFLFFSFLSFPFFGCFEGLFSLVGGACMRLLGD